MLQQISLFTENKAGALYKITTVLADSNINIYTMLANDSAEFGIIRLIVDKPNEATEVLQGAGYQCRLDKVIAVTMEDVPGYLNKILAAVDGANIDICYLYISFERHSGKPVAVFRTNEPETATFLLGKGFNLIETF